eukprot:366175-Chlamydomonas_euryale.AAC.6
MCAFGAFGLGVTGVPSPLHPKTSPPRPRHAPRTSRLRADDHRKPQQPTWRLSQETRHACGARQCEGAGRELRRTHPFCRARVLFATAPARDRRAGRHDLADVAAPRHVCHIRSPPAAHPSHRQARPRISWCRRPRGRRAPTPKLCLDGGWQLDRWLTVRSLAVQSELVPWPKTRPSATGSRPPAPRRWPHHRQQCVYQRVAFGKACGSASRKQQRIHMLWWRCWCSHGAASFVNACMHSIV